MSLYFEQQSGEVVARRIPRIVQGGDDGIEARFNNAPLSLAPVWQTTPQEWQPPAARVYQRYAGTMRADVVDRSDIGPFVIPFAEGWKVQQPQPPSPFGPRSGRLIIGATARGDDGIIAIFVPPWQFANRAATFPDYQNIAAGAIPSWQAGPPPGAIKSMPNIASPMALKTSPGNLLTINIVVAGSAPGGVYDCVGNFPSTLNQIAVLPNTVDGKPIVYDWPCQQGILIVPGTGQIVSVKWD